jgi:hypothetical protein
MVEHHGYFTDEKARAVGGVVACDCGATPLRDDARLSEPFGDGSRDLAVDGVALVRRA